MTTDMTFLGRRAAVCDGWRWLTGMRDTNGWTYISGSDWTYGAGIGAERGSKPETHPAPPDLTDPCTLGGLLALVREAWGDEFLMVEVNEEHTVDEDGCGEGWWRPGGGFPQSFDTEAEALVEALERAPVR